MKGEKGKNCEHRTGQRASGAILTRSAEFSGTLVGFDDYVSELTLSILRSQGEMLIISDMVLEDVTEL